MKKEKNNKFKKLLSKMKKPLLFFSVILNILFGLAIVIGLSSKSKTQSVKVMADDVINDLTYTSWLINEQPGINLTYNFNVNFISNNNDYSYIVFTELPLRLMGFSYGSDDVYLSSTGWLSEEYRSIYFTGGDDVENQMLIDWLNDNAVLVSAPEPEPIEYKFIFSKTFNYNAPYNTSGNSPFVLGSAGFKTYSFSSYFLSNGEYFNTIRLSYISGNGTAYFDENNIVRVNNNTSLIQYNYMEYLNTDTNVSKVVNNRNFTTYYNTASSTTNLAMEKGSTWTNSNYQILSFDFELTPQETTYINQFNNYDIYTGLSDDSISNDVGLSNVFTLLKMAFSSFAGIFAIQLLPGITIGLLFFMPLIVGIILFIIWLIKR